MTLEKSLSVLYIEDNIDDQLILKRTLKRSINAEISVDTATTAAEGFTKLSMVDYDLVFLDYRLPDKTGIEFLEEIRTEGYSVPVIFLTGMGSEKVAIQAMRAGVEDYIIKSDIQTDEFIETIRKRLLGNVKPETAKSELNDVEEEVYREIQNSGFSIISLEITEGQLGYNGLKKFVETEGFEVASIVLEQLAEKGLLKEVQANRLIICPRCSSSVTDPASHRYSCSNCLSPNVLRVHFLSHPFCGYTGNRTTFVTDRGLVCPNCKIALKNQIASKGTVNKEGYQMLGNAYECQDCETRFSRPEMLHTCPTCGEKFSNKNMGYIYVKEYELIKE
jgi:DNA-binding response OmpR family regulator